MNNSFSSPPRGDAEEDLKEVISSAPEISQSGDADLLEHVLEAGQLGFWDWNVTTGEVIFSDQWARMLGMNPAEVEPRVTVWQGLTHPDDEQRTMEILEAHMRGETDCYESEHRLKRKDGHWVWVLDRGKVIERDAEGKPLRVVGTQTDITQRKEAERQVLAKDGLIRALINVLPEIVWSAGVDGKLDFANQKWFDFIGSQNDDVQEAFLKALHPEDALSVRDHWLGSRESGETFNSVLRLKNSDGEYRWFQVRGEPSRDGDDDDGITHWFGIAVDITVQRRADEDRIRFVEAEKHLREEAELANKSKDDFLAMLSHELRAPLNAIYGWVQILERGDLEKEKVARAVDVIGRNVRLQKSLIDDLLDLSRIISGKIRIEMQNLSFNSVVRNAVEAVRPAADRKGITVNSALNLDPDEMRGDRDRLLQVIGNILTNALKYTPEGGEINLQLDRVGERAVLTISDNGEGIEPHLIPRIFGLFKDAGALGQRKFGGLGIGLTLVKYFVEAHGGTVSAASEGPGRGAAFRIELPLVY